MPQSNPTISESKSETFSQGLSDGGFIDTGSGNIWYINSVYTIPAEFSSIEWIVHIRTIDGGNAPIIYWFSDLAPGEDQTTWFDGNNVILPLAIGGPTPAGYPGIIKYGMGPSFDGISTTRPTGDPINQPNFLPIMATTGGSTYVVTTITTPIRLIFALATGDPPNAPEVDGTIYNTFYR